ncbi:MAG: IclR family transcriptional regulator [Anaerolineae bacterium]
MAQPSRLIGSVERALDILNLFDLRTAELGTTEIAEAVGLHKSTAASLIYTLAAKGYLAQNPRTRKYSLGLKLIERSAVVLHHLEVRRVAYPHLEALRDRCGETVNLAVLDGADIVYIERLLCTRALGMRSEIGKRALAHSTALGKAILAHWPTAEVGAFVQRFGLPRVTAKTITDPTEFLRQLEEARALGYAIDDEENEEGGRCVAAPLFDYTGKPIASISLSAPVSRLSLADAPRFAALVRETAHAISLHLGAPLPRAPQGLADA